MKFTNSEVQSVYEVYSVYTFVDTSIYNRTGELVYEYVYDFNGDSKGKRDSLKDEGYACVNRRIFPDQRTYWMSNARNTYKNLMDMCEVYFSGQFDSLPDFKADMRERINDEAQEFHKQTEILTKDYGVEPSEFSTEMAVLARVLCGSDSDLFNFLY